MNEDEAREALAEVLSREAAVSERYVGQFAYWQGLADALLPAVRKIAADELRAAAAEWTDFQLATDQLRARVDALDPPP